MDDPRKHVVFEVRPGLTRVRAPNPSPMTGSGTNCYIVGTTDMIVIDPGPEDVGHIDRILELSGARLRYVLVTHRHRDHAPAARPIADAVGVPVLGYGYGEELIPDGELRDGDVIAVPGYRVEVVYTPGHSSDHLCFIADPEDASSSDRFCISGDHIMGGSSVAILPTDGSMGAYLESLERLIGLDRGVTAILPGHGEVIEDPERVLRNYMENRLAREKLVLAALTSNPQSPAEIVPGIYRGLDERLYRAAAATVWAHLRKLGDEGLAASEEPDARDGRWVLTAVAEG